LFFFPRRPRGQRKKNEKRINDEGVFKRGIIFSRCFKNFFVDVTAVVSGWKKSLAFFFFIFPFFFLFFFVFFFLFFSLFFFFPNPMAGGESNWETLAPLSESEARVAALLGRASRVKLAPFLTAPTADVAGGASGVGPASPAAVVERIDDDDRDDAAQESSVAATGAMAESGSDQRDDAGRGSTDDGDAPIRNAHQFHAHFAQLTRERTKAALQPYRTLLARLEQLMGTRVFYLS
jgi:hypothetical protein